MSFIGGSVGYNLLRLIHASSPKQFHTSVDAYESSSEKLLTHFGSRVFEQAEVLSKVQENYLALAADDPSRFVIVDAEKESEEIAKFVGDVIRQKSGSSRSRRRS